MSGSLPESHFLYKNTYIVVGSLSDKTSDCLPYHRSIAFTQSGGVSAKGGLWLGLLRKPQKSEVGELVHDRFLPGGPPRASGEATPRE